MTEITKSSDEILTELFDSFKSETPAKSDVSDSPKSTRGTKTKKKHKKDKRHKNDDKEHHKKKKKCKRHKKKTLLTSSEKIKSKRKKKHKHVSESSETETDNEKSKQDNKELEEPGPKTVVTDDPKQKVIKTTQDTKVVPDSRTFEVCDTSSIPLPPVNGEMYQKDTFTQKQQDEIKKPTTALLSEVFEKDNDKTAKKIIFKPLDKPKMPIKIGNLKNSHVLEVAEEQAKLKAEKYEEGEIVDESSEESTRIAHTSKTDSSHEKEVEVHSVNEDKKRHKHHHHHHHKKCSKRGKCDTNKPSHKVVSSPESSDGSAASDANETRIKKGRLSDDPTDKVKHKKSESDSDSSETSERKIKLKRSKKRHIRERVMSDDSSDDEILKGNKKIKAHRENEGLEKMGTSKSTVSNRISKHNNSDSSSSSSSGRRNISKVKSRRSSSSKRLSSKRRSRSLQRSRSGDRLKISRTRSRNSKSESRGSRSCSRSRVRRRVSRSLSRRSRSRNRMSVSRNRSFARSRGVRSSSRRGSSRRIRSRTPLVSKSRKSRSRSPFKRSNSRNRSSPHRSRRSLSRQKSRSKDRKSRSSKSRENKSSSSKAKRSVSRAYSREKDSNKDKKSKKTKHKQRDINSRLLALSRTKVESSSSDSSESDSSESDSKTRKNVKLKAENKILTSKEDRGHSKNKILKDTIKPNKLDQNSKTLKSKKTMSSGSSGSSSDSENCNSEHKSKSSNFDMSKQKQLSQCKNSKAKEGITLHPQTSSSDSEVVSPKLKSSKLSQKSSHQKTSHKKLPKKFLKGKGKNKDQEIETESESNSHISEPEGERSDTALRKKIFSQSKSSGSSGSESTGTINKNLLLCKSTEKTNKYECRIESSLIPQKKPEEKKQKGFFNLETDLYSNKETSPKATIKKPTPASDESSIEKKSVDDNITDSENEALKSKILLGKYDSCSDEDSSKTDGSSLKKPTSELQVEIKDSSIVHEKILSTTGCNEICSKNSPQKEIGNDLYYDYDKLETEDEKLDFEEDKSCEADSGETNVIHQETAIDPLQVDSKNISNQNLEPDSDGSAVISKPLTLESKAENKEHAVLPSTVSSENEFHKDDNILANTDLTKSVDHSLIHDLSSIPNPDEKRVYNKVNVVPLTDKKPLDSSNTNSNPCNKSITSNVDAIANRLKVINENISLVKDMTSLSDKSKQKSPTRSLSRERTKPCPKSPSTDVKSCALDKTSKRDRSSSRTVKSKDKSPSRTSKSKDKSPFRSKSNDRLSSRKSKSVDRSSARRPKTNNRSSSRRSKSKDRSSSKRSKSKEVIKSGRLGSKETTLKNNKRSRSRDKTSPSKERKTRSRERKSRSRERKSKSREKKSRERKSRSRERKSRSRERKSRSEIRCSRSKDKKRFSRDNNSGSNSRISRSRDKSGQAKKSRERSRDKRSRSGRRGASRSRRLSSSRDKRSRSNRRCGSLLKERKSRSKSRRRSRSRDRKSRSRGTRNRSRSKSKRKKPRSSSREKRSRSRTKTRKERSRSRRRKSRSKDKTSSSCLKRARSESSRSRSRCKKSRSKSLTKIKKISTSKERKILPHTSESIEKSKSPSLDSKTEKANQKEIDTAKLNSKTETVLKVQETKSNEKAVVSDEPKNNLNHNNTSENGNSSKSSSRENSRSASREKSPSNSVSKESDICKSLPKSKSVGIVISTSVPSNHTETKNEPTSIKVMGESSPNDRCSSPAVNASKSKDIKEKSRSKSVERTSKINEKSSDERDNKVKDDETKSLDKKYKLSSKQVQDKHSKTRERRSRSKEKRSQSKERRSRQSESRSRKSRSRDKRSKSKDKRSRSKDRHRSRDKRSKSRDRRSKSRVRHSKSRERWSKSRERRSKSRDRRSKSRERTRRSKSRERRSKSRDRRSKSREKRSKSRDKKSRRSRTRSRSRSRRRKSDKKDRSRRSHSRSKSRTHKHTKKSRSRSRGKDEFFIDKSKLLEIARKNALSMMKQGAVGTDLNKVTAITAGGKTVDELTDFCKLLSQKEATGQESLSSESSSENESEKPFHHPFQLKERSNNIIMNIRNCASLPVKTHQEKTTENAHQLRLQFPVSSGQLHRKTENEWIPVSPKKTDEIKAIMPPPIVHPQEAAIELPIIQEKINFATIPLPTQLPMPTLTSLPLTPIMNTWGQNQNSGLFTGTTGARVLSQAELASGQQAWAKKDQLISAQPVKGGMGMSLLQKMGWKPGEGLGRRNEGTLEPLKLQVKMDKRGLVCAEEIPQPKFKPHLFTKPPPPPPVKSMEGKHPVSLLVEYCTRNHWNPPLFTVLSEDGPAHKKNFVFKVSVNGVDYQPANPSPNKKLAKSEAAIMCLRALGLLPTV